MVAGVWHTLNGSYDIAQFEVNVGAVITALSLFPLYVYYQNRELKEKDAEVDNR